MKRLLDVKGAASAFFFDAGTPPLVAASAAI
jgi:hypothetical protein